ncbi:MAG: nitric oxide reductase activation protein [Eubacteriales bacterium]|nr:nitric oxide reductase activation protein [Eubacteriales bacterium]
MLDKAGAYRSSTQEASRQEAFGDLESSFEIENRIKNLLWTVSGDYSLEIRPDVPLFLRSKAIELYDGIKQGAFARYYDREEMSMYLVKKVFLQADEAELMLLTQLCIEEAVGDKICQERPGIRSMQTKAFEDILDQEFEILPSYGDAVGRLRLALLRDRLSGKRGTFRVERQLERWRDMVYEAGEAETTQELIALVDILYNTLVDPDFEKRIGGLDRVLAVPLEELRDYDWRELLSEELYEDALETYMEQMNSRMTGLEREDVTEAMEEERKVKHKITVLPPEALEKAHDYVELNFGKTYLSENEEKRRNFLMCRGLHEDCSLYFTEGILRAPVKKNYQYEYAKRLRSKNLYHYHDKHRIAKHNIAQLTDLLRKTLILHQESERMISDRGQILPGRLWRVGRSSDARLFLRELNSETRDFVVDVLIDASGSQMARQGQVALQGYMIAEALSNVGISHRVMSFCTFWDYTILHRLRDYDDDRSANDNIFNYVTSSNNRDGLAIKAAGHELLQRNEDKKIMIILSDGRPYDVVVNRPNAKNPKPYKGSYGVADTAFEVRRLRNLGVSVLGVFAGEEKDLAAEKKIFGKDFAYIRDITGFSRIVGKYLVKQLD